MAAVATGSRVAKQNAWIVIVMCVAFGIYFIYDGWISENYQRRNITWRFQPDDIRNPTALAEKLRSGRPAISAHLFARMERAAQDRIAAADLAAPGPDLAALLAQQLDRLLDRPDAFPREMVEALPQGTLSEDTIDLMQRERLVSEDMPILHRMILQDVYPDALADQTWRDGQATANLKFNRYYGPLVCLIAAIYFLMRAARYPKMRLEAGEEAVTVAGGPTIPYSDIRKIDTRELDKKGRFTIYYEQGGQEKALPLSGREYDGLRDVYQQIVAKTNAAPADQPPTPDNNAPQS